MGRPSKLTDADHEATKHLSTHRAAEVLGVSFGAVKRLRDRLGFEWADARFQIQRDRHQDWAETFTMTYVEAAEYLGESVKYVQTIRRHFDPPELDRWALYAADRAQQKEESEAGQRKGRKERKALLRKEREARLQKERKDARKVGRPRKYATPEEAAEVRRVANATRMREARAFTRASAPKRKSTFDRTPYEGLLAEFEEAMLDDIGYAIKIASVGSKLVEKKRLREGLPPLERPEELRDVG